MSPELKDRIGINVQVYFISKSIYLFYVYVNSLICCDKRKAIIEILA